LQIAEVVSHPSALPLRREGHKVLIFSQFVEALKTLVGCFDAA